MKKMIIIALTIILLIGIVLLKNNASKNDEVKIGILQTASHPALDAVREGVIEELQKNSNQIKVLYKNAEGSSSLACALAQDLHKNSEIKAIITIGTLATQAAVQAEDSKPIIYTAVTNPQVIGIKHEQKNICGISDSVDIKTQIRQLRLLLPGAKTVGIIYNPTEANSVFSVKNMQEISSGYNLQTITIGINSEADMPIAAASICAKVDVVLLPTDNTVGSTLPILIRQANKSKIPVICGVDLWVTQGCLMSTGGIDYKNSGKIAALYTKEILSENKQVKDITLEKSNPQNPVINNTVLKNLNIQLPVELAQHCVYR